MISDSWNNLGRESISQKVMSKVKPGEPLKNKIDVAQKKLQFQISKLQSINEKLQKKHDVIFEKIVNAQRNNKPSYVQSLCRRTYTGKKNEEHDKWSKAFHGTN